MFFKYNQWLTNTCVPFFFCLSGSVILRTEDENHVLDVDNDHSDAHDKHRVDHDDAKILFSVDSSGGVARDDGTCFSKETEESCVNSMDRRPGYEGECEWCCGSACHDNGNKCEPTGWLDDNGRSIGKKGRTRSWNYCGTFECASGQGPQWKASDWAQKSRTDCENWCLDKNCVGFDFTTNEQIDSCRLYTNASGYRTDGGKDERVYCKRKLSMCPTTTDSRVLGCMDGTTCNVDRDASKWSCCGLRGGRTKCPKGLRMCTKKICGFESKERCCRKECNGKFGPALSLHDCPATPTTTTTQKPTTTTQKPATTVADSETGVTKKNDPDNAAKNDKNTTVASKKGDEDDKEKNTTVASNEDDEEEERNTPDEEEPDGSTTTYLIIGGSVACVLLLCGGGYFWMRSSSDTE